MPTALALAALSLTSLTLAARQQAPPPTQPPPATAALVTLGKMLFWEEQLSSDDSMACGTCHRPSAGGGDPRADAALHPGADGVFGTADDVRGSTGMVRTLANGDFTPDAVFGLRQHVTRRAAPGVLDAADAPTLQWDGGVDDHLVDPLTGAVAIAGGAALEHQALLPLLDPGEMGHVGRTWADVTQKLAAATPMRLASALPADVQRLLLRCADYPALFAAVFGDPAITPTRLAVAIGAYERTLRTGATPWDRFAAGDPTALGRRQLGGWRLFEGKARCASCHPAPAFTDHAFHDLGVRPATEDVGRAAVDPTAVPGAFRTPTLRSAGLRPRLFHNGQSPSLADPRQTTATDAALQVHWRGGGGFALASDPLLPDLRQQGLTLAEMVLVFEFVRTALVDPRVAAGLPPFDHPELRSVREAPPRVFGAPLVGTSEPFLIDWVPPFPGNTAFHLGLVGSVPGSLAALSIGLQPFEPAVTVQGVPFHLEPLAWQLFLLGGAAGQPGHATWHVPLPDDPGLATIPLYYQMFVGDPAAPGGVAASSGAEFFIR
ncbi:MAG: hypothetical protein H6835_07040 [Planctomycetes bacterium]|nr:hypothetical protein [Planctomycetota bacterium]